MGTLSHCFDMPIEYTFYQHCVIFLTIILSMTQHFDAKKSRFVNIMTDLYRATHS